MVGGDRGGLGLGAWTSTSSGVACEGNHWTECGCGYGPWAVGWSQERLAEEAGLHWTYVGQVERGRRNITLPNILKLAAGLKVSPAVLVEGLSGEP